ncbi:heme-binding domain-containing protein [Capnocytophaga sp. ARDL2]|uniref:heme-binding domain-containing protein n=1 Tax=Capnocytophaga sp. ARDL2 TaxID=3238809 RepID=UPI0035572D1B
MVIAGLQLFQIDKTNLSYDETKDFLVVNQTPNEVATLIRNACYDCHSYETKYPWYTYVQPVGWFVKDHIMEGRQELNFSIFDMYSPQRKIKKIEESAECIEIGEMPLTSYVITHPEANLSNEAKSLLINYFRSLQSNYYTQTNDLR